MSHLEATAKRVLTGPARSIPAQEARLLAQWAEKTAVVLNLSQTFPLAWNRDDRGSVVDGPSSRSRVSLFRVADSDVNFVQGDFITATAPSGWPTSTKVAALQLVHVSRVCIGRIVVVTMHVPWQAQPLRNCRMPGQEIWSGSKAHPFDAETLPVLESWRDGIVAFEIGESAFWRTPSLHDIYRPVDWA